MLSISLRGLLAFGSTATAKFKGILSCCRIASAIGVNWGSGESFFFFREHRAWNAGSYHPYGGPEWRFIHGKKLEQLCAEAVGSTST